jgi:hypothetical protein
VFEDETHPNYLKDAADPAWSRTLEFLRRQLGVAKAQAAE